MNIEVGFVWLFKKNHYFCIENRIKVDYVNISHSVSRYAELFIKLSVIVKLLKTFNMLSRDYHSTFKNMYIPL